MMSSDDEYDIDSDYEQEKEGDLKFLTYPELQTEMNAVISDVTSVLQVKSGVARILLHKYKWNKDSLMEQFFESPDTNAFLIAAQVIPKTAKTFPTVPQAECQICCDIGELTGLACGHRACNGCWTAYLTEKIMDGRQCEIECMMPKCKLIIEDEKINLYISDPTVLDMYQKMTVNSYVMTNIFYKWCPGAECGRAVKLPDCDRHIITCPCGSIFCSTCGNDTHEPISCEYLKYWRKRCQEDAETCNWIVAHTKECPKCHTTIEKNGGCNHMSCRSSSCRYEFCWLCMGPWLNHNNCNSFDKKEQSRTEARESLNRYLFYYNMYVNHQQSLKLEENLKAIVDLRMEQMQGYGVSWVDVQTLKNAIQVLSTCRRTLMYTYAFAFFLTKNNESVIFESNQNDLQMAVEQLSGSLEKELDDELDESGSIHTLLLAIQDKCRYVERRRQTLLDHCAEGDNMGSWKFNQTLTR